MCVGKGGGHIFGVLFEGSDALEAKKMGFPKLNKTCQSSSSTVPFFWHWAKRDLRSMCCCVFYSTAFCRKTNAGLGVSCRVIIFCNNIGFP